MHFWVLPDMPHALLLGRIGMRQVGLALSRVVEGKPVLFRPTNDLYQVPECNLKFYDELGLSSTHTATADILPS